MAELINQAGLFPAHGTSTEATLWERVAKTKWGAYVSSVEERAILHAQKMAGPPSAALEIGCEGGRWSKMLFDLGWEMTCIDVNPKALQECQRKVPTANCLLAASSDTTIPREAASLNLLLCIEVAPVVQSNWFLNEAYRVLAEKGVLVGIFWNRASWRGSLTRFKYRLSPPRFGEYYSSSYVVWRRDLIRTGFELAHQEGFCWGPCGRASNSPFVFPAVFIERFFSLYRLVSLSPWVVFIARKT